MDGPHGPRRSSEHLPSRLGFCSNVAAGGCPVVPAALKRGLEGLVTVPTAAAMLLSIRSMIQNRKNTLLLVE